MKRSILLALCVLAGALASVSGAAADTVTVPGAANPFLTGYGSGGSVTIGGYIDSVPTESPVFVFNVAGGEMVQFGPVTGTVSHGSCCDAYGPNGQPGVFTSSAGGTTVGGYTNFPIDALVGVFYDPSAAQGAVNGSTTTLTPAVNQVFFIGDGLLGAFTVPTGATALYLGTVDGFQWSNNTGFFEVTASIVPGPAPGEGALSVALIILMGFAARFRGLVV